VAIDGRNAAWAIVVATFPIKTHAVEINQPA
jgi:hypothetical protein